MRLFLIFLLFSHVLGYDVVVQSLLELIDRNTDPCDNFYRHVCPLGSPFKRSMALIEEASINTDGIWDDIQIVSDLVVPSDFNFSDAMTQLYIEQCENGKDTEYYLTSLSTFTRYPMNYMKHDSNCQRVGAQIKDILDNYFPLKIMIRASIFNYTLSTHLNAVKSISLLLDNDLEETVLEMNALVEEFKDIAKAMITKTPWVKNNNLTNLVTTPLELTHLNQNYAKMIRNSFNVIMKFELPYRSCKQNFENHELSPYFCFMITAEKNTGELWDGGYYSNVANAFNSFPLLGFGYPFYYMTKNLEEMATKLGAVGFVVGHEVSHTIIRGEHDTLLTHSSQEAMDCIQEQFNSTCTEFKEKSCDADIRQLDENGADVLGLQLAYQMLEKHYGDKLKETYTPLNITYQQLFFYSSVMFFCKGEPGDIYVHKDGRKDVHSVSNIRINAMVNHPAFKEAFQCSDDSRMMKSATKQCKIFGEDAPANRKL